MKFKYINNDHQRKFQEIRNEMPDNYRNSSEYLSVVFIIASNDELYAKIRPYFNEREGVFSSDKMFEEQDFSSSKRTLARLAVHLFNNNETVVPLDFMSLDDEQLSIVINAILLRRYGVSNSYNMPEERFYM